jgi:acyl-CoA hydrolase
VNCTSLWAGTSCCWASAACALKATAATRRVRDRWEDQGRYVKVTEARLTYVAIDDQGRPRPVPKHNAPG